MTYQKGIDRFVRAVESLNNSSKAEQDNIEFLIFGTGPLSYLADKLDKRYKNVTYMRYVDRIELINAYQSSHLFVFPTRFEEFPLVGLEAQAAGTPILGSDIPVLHELVTNGTTGYIINSDNPGHMKDMVLYFRNLWYNNKHSSYQRYCLNCRQNAQKYDWQRILDSLEDMLKAVVQGKEYKAPNETSEVMSSSHRDNER
jgi:glycosyltransferase involved in cell wall biosynthesis